MDGTEISTLAALGRPVQPDGQPGEIGGQIGVVVSVSGFRLSCLLQPAEAPDLSGFYPAAQIGALVKIATNQSMAFGFIDNLTLEPAPDGDLSRAKAVAQIDLLGELTGSRAGKAPSFARGISIFPVLGAPVYAATSDDLSVIYARPDTWTMTLGSLYQDVTKPAYLLSQEFLSKHSAIVGTTGSGKSCALTLILRNLLTAHPNGHVVLVDPHGEYASAFTGMAETLTTRNLQLPYWLLSFEEIVEVLCSHDANDRSRETVILKETILAAKRDYVGATGPAGHITVDTPVPYRLSSAVQRINEAMGKLDRPDSTLPYLRLLTTIENLRRDRRYGFMFEGFAVRDNMAEIMSRILRIPVSGKPLTILDISSVPSEIVNVVMSVLCRLIFDFALQSEREQTVPILLVCDEAHRYVPRDETQGFAPTRRSIARIAKEGRKYCVSLCLVTQRPSELSEAILSQCSTMIALRMTNEKDQSYVRGMLPDTASGLLNTLPTLRQREAIIVGEGVAHPMRIRFADLLPEHRPKGEGTSFPLAWQEDAKKEDFVTSIIERWRRL